MKFRTNYRIIAAGWSCLILALAVYVAAMNWSHAGDMAVHEARVALEKDIVLREWAAGHGSVYVPAGAATPPNPHLAHMPERDIATPSGRLLTLMNPEYIAREVNELARLRHGVRGHITSLTPIRQGNEPDAWEREALHAFERGAREKSALQRIDGIQYMRLMIPLRAEKPCLMCHAAQGAREGELRGGVSASIPFEKFRSEFMRETVSDMALLGLLWAVGIVFIRSRTRKMEEISREIVEAEKKYRGLDESIEENTFLYVHDLNGVFQYLSDSITRILGYQPEEFKTHYTKYLTDHPVNQAVVRLTEQSMQGVKVPPYQVEIFHKDGTRRWLEVTETPLRNAANEVSGVQGIARDVTEQKHKAEELAFSEAYLKSIINNEPECVKLLDEACTVLAMNPSGLAMIDADSEDQVRGKSALDIVDEEYRKPFADFTKRVCSGEPGMIEFSITGLKGSKRWLESHAVPFRGRNGERLLLGVTRDVTGRKKAEQEKAALEDQLRQSQKMEAVGILAGGVAHDFNNILQGILGYGDLLRMQDRNLTQQQKEYLAVIMSSARKAAELTKNLLAFSRKHPMEFRPVDLNSAIRSVDGLLHRIIGEDIEFETRFCPETLVVMADAQQLQHALINLATNARDAMPGGGKLTIRTERMVLDDEFVKVHGFGERGVYAVLSVSDTGVGIEDHVLEHIFEPFYTTKEVGKGTGLGLSTVYAIVSQHAGHITAESRKGGPTTFTIYLRCTEEAAASVSQEHEKAFLRGTETILLAEDDEIVRKMMVSMLRELGYTVLVAENGEDACRIFAELGSDIRLVILDMIMPKMNGREALATMRKARPDLEWLFISGYTADLLMQKGLREESERFVMKPISFRELSEKIRFFLRRKTT
ncbi:MAG: hypothetical protein OHK006_22670 [Thermodesulfovibrionales bacterium]